MPNRLPEKLPSLDGLRGIAIALVFVHTTNVVEVSNSIFGSILPKMASIGWVGVQLFFVLSGFLITRYLLAHQGTPHYFKNFYGRRVLRIFPLYYATLIFFFVVLPWAGLAPQGIRDDQSRQIWFWLFLSNWTEFIGFGGLSLPHLWSIAVEEQFYLLWPLVVWRTPPKRLIHICIAIALASLFSRFLMAINGANDMVVYTSTNARVDALVLGAASAALFTLPGMTEKLVKLRWVIFVASLIVTLAGAAITHNFGHLSFIGETFSYGFLACTFTLVLVWAIASEAAPQQSWMHRALSSAPLRILGKYSFGLYIFHVPLHIYMGLKLLEYVGWRDHPNDLHALIYLLLIGMGTFTLTWLSFHLLEKRFLVMKRYFI
jgi:peptidoglycan/LPS O-acetylase OafA/YrhL